MIKGTGNFTTGNFGQPFNSVKIRVFNRHNAAFRKDRFGQVVNQLTVDKDVASVCQNLVALGPHLGLFRLFNVGHLLEAVHPDAGTINLDLVRVHGSVGHENLCLFHAFRLSDSYRLLEQESILYQKRSMQLTALDFQHLNEVDIARSSETQHGIHGQRGKVFLFVRQEFARERGLGNLNQVFAKLFRISTLIDGVGFECLSSNIPR
mmetsp:Transcript_26203/g.40177  ORF Transcript_26203/g.40177 Transcript_26203/m.40177 type:complete len:207 (+) Transcript_26203:673-1293(+)